MKRLTQKPIHSFNRIRISRIETAAMTTTEIQ